MKSKPLLLIIAFLFSTGSIFAQTSAEAAKDVNFQISFADGKNVYRIGEPVKIILSYTSTQPGYVVETVGSPKKDDVFVSPKEGIYDWLYRLNRLSSYDDVSLPRIINAVPSKVEIVLNDLVRFDKPGKYQVKVITKRVTHPKKTDDWYSNPIPLLSNTIELEMKEMSEAQEAAEVKRISTSLDSAKNLREYQTAEQDLDYLTGDASTFEKVNRFLKPPVFDNIKWTSAGMNLTIARNKQLAVKLLEEAFRDPNREADQNLIIKIVGLKLLMENEKTPSEALDSPELLEKRKSRLSELTKAYYKELLDSIPKRTARGQIVAAISIFNTTPASSPEYLAAKTLLLERFDTLAYFEQADLLGYNWEKIKTPALIPSLEKILASKEPAPNWDNRANAFKRLIELDQKRARPFVINEISNPDSNTNPEILVTLSDKNLPEVDAALLEQIKTLAASKDNRVMYKLAAKLTLAARFATAKIYPEMLEVYKKYALNWGYERSGPLLAYLALHNDKEAMPLLEERLAKSGEKGGYTILLTITKSAFTRGMEKMMQKRLAKEDSDVSMWASYFLSKYGGKENRKLIEARLNLWYEKWKNRRADLENPDVDAETKAQPMFQISMIDSLIDAKNWKLTETEAYQLKLNCLTENCRRHFSARDRDQRLKAKQ